MKKFRPNYDEAMWQGAPVSSFLKAKELRKNATEAEKLVWEKLKDNKVKNCKFRRQHPVNLYIADFYSHKFKLIIEIDGGYHLSEEQTEKDIERTAVLNSSGLEVLRFSNDEVVRDIESVLARIVEKIEEIENSFPQP